MGSSGIMSILWEISSANMDSCRDMDNKWIIDGDFKWKRNGIISG